MKKLLPRIVSGMPEIKTTSSGQHTSQLLAAIAQQMEATDSISLQELMGTLGERVFGMSILLFSIPNCLPIPNVAALSALTGIPIGILGLQMILGRSHPWLPSALGEKRFSGQWFSKFLERAVPTIRKVEVLLHPRLQVMTGKSVQRLLGVAFVALATVMSLPIPFGNMLPGFAIALMAIGLLERDGLIIVLGLSVGAATVTLMFTVADAILSAIQSFWG